MGSFSPLMAQWHLRIGLGQGVHSRDLPTALATKKYPTNKRTNSRWPSVGINKYLRTGPILTTPGGWGLRNPEPKGPGQRSACYSQGRTASRWRKWGIIVIVLTIP